MDKIYKDRNNWLEMDDIKLCELCEFSTFKSTGPGGQKRNKSSSAVRLKHIPTGITVTASESRSQHKNRHIALKKLRLEIAVTFQGACTPELSLKTSLKNPKYALLAAKIMDIFRKNNYALKASAEEENLSSSQMMKIISRDKKLLDKINKERQKIGLNVLKRI